MRVGLRMAWASVMMFKDDGKFLRLHTHTHTHTHLLTHRVKCEVRSPVRALGVAALDDRSPRTP